MKRLILAVTMLVAGVAAAPARDWSANIAATPQGGYVMGNPAAKVKLVEYLSYTCSHCAHFTGEAKTPLKRDYVSSGKVSFEVRVALRDRYDFAAALLARCGGPARFFGNTEAIMAAQPAWMGRIQAFEKANPAPPADMNASLRAIAKGVGLDAVMRARGLQPAQIDKCLTDKAAQQTLAAMADEAWAKRKIGGTPAFVVNGGTPAPGSWATVEPQLRAAAGG